MVFLLVSMSFGDFSRAESLPQQRTGLHGLYKKQPSRRFG
jgi:hypothetical protein